MPDFWRHSGFHLLERSDAGRLRVTDDFLRAYLLRPEVRPMEESGAGERALHAALLEAPRQAVSEAELARIEDEDARFNYRVLLDFRQRLLDAPTVEAAYARIFEQGNSTVPPLFLDQLAQIILRNVLDGCEAPLEARAAELFWREQKVSLNEGTIMSADLEAIELHASGSVYGNLGRLVMEAQTPIKQVSLDVLDVDNAHSYWQRDERHDFVISLNHGRAAPAALARVMERWIDHFFGVRVKIEPVRQIQDQRWAWHIGLDAQSSAILDALWRGEEVEAGELRRLLCLFRLSFEDDADMRADIAGRPVYLALAMNDANIIRMKPQNLLLNLPLAART